MGLHDICIPRYRYDWPFDATHGVHLCDIFWSFSIENVERAPDFCIRLQNKLLK